MASFYGFVQRLYKIRNPPTCAKTEPIRFGVLGAANIAPPALVLPALSHPEVVVYAVAARSLEKAQGFAHKHGIDKVYGGPQAYQELLDDPNVDAVYNPLPNGLHYEWTMKALQAGKHVLLEKPSADTAEETREMFQLAKAKGLVLLEAFHYRFHPAMHRAKAIMESGELGAIKHAEATLKIPKGLMPEDDIRFNYSLGGGAMMDMGCYTVSSLRYVFGADPLSVISAIPLEVVATQDGSTPNVDAGMTATFAFPGDATATIGVYLREPPRFGFIPRMPSISLTVTCENGEMKMFNYVMPSIYHYIEVTTKSGPQGKTIKKRVEKVYKPLDANAKGEEWWLTYRYQLEAFVDKIKGRTPAVWVTEEDSVANMTWIEKVYETTGLGSRPRSSFKLPVL